MAITVTQRGAVNTNADANPVSIASVALTSGRFYVAVICTSIASGDAPSITGITATGLSMTRFAPSGDDGLYASRRIDLWYGNCTSSGTVTVSAELSATSTQSDLAIYEIDGVDNTGDNGVNAIVQCVCLDNGGTSVGGIDLSLAAFASSDNRPFAFVQHRANEATAHNSGGGYTELLDASHNSPSGGFCVQWHSSSADTAPSWTWATSAQAGAIGIELKAATGSVEVTPPTASLTLTTFAPTVTASDHKSVTVPTAELATSLFAPSVTVGVRVTPPAAELAIATFAPLVEHEIIVPVASLELTTFAPTVTAGTGVEIVVPTAALALTAFAPQVNLGVTVPPAEIETTAFAPVISSGIVVPAAELAITTHVPVIGLEVVPTLAELVLTTFEPSISVAMDVTVEVATASLALTSFAPVVTSSTPLPVVTTGPWQVSGNPGDVALNLGDEWYVVITGPSADAPKIRVTIIYS